MKNYKAIGKIGEGTFSEVMKMQSLRDGNYYACKQMKQHFESSFTVWKNPFWNVLKDHDFPPPKAKNVIGLHLRPIAEISLLCWSLPT